MTGRVADDATISVVVVSQNRPAWLSRCLTALSQLDYPAFEVIVVTDGPGHAAASAHPTAPDTTLLIVNEANVATLRNRGIEIAKGEWVAFIDDDAVPEPLWLQRHIEALAATSADASVGYVRGRNGISFQSRAASVDNEAETHSEPSPNSAPCAPDLATGRALKLIGTNCVIRRNALLALNGFDPAFRFYLDDTDISMRLMNAGYRACVAPHAEVHHTFAPSPRRTAARRPKQLFDIGRSTAIFLRRHPGADNSEIWDRLFLREKGRLERHLIQGTCEPRDVSNLLTDLANGWDQGASEPLAPLAALNDLAEGAFVPFPVLQPGCDVISSRLLRRKAKLATASLRAKSGKRVSFFSFSLTPVRHHVRYSECGVWVQTGGQFGRSDRENRLFRWCRFAKRMKEEIRRVEMQRGIDQN